MWRVKVCGLTNLEDAEFAWEEGADALGFVLEPKSPRFVADWAFLNQAHKLLGAQTVAVFGEYSPADLTVFDAVQAFGPDQKVGKAWMPVFRPRDNQPVDDWLAATSGWEWCALDPFSVVAQGGSGTRLDWDLAADFVKKFAGKVILAGGLNDENVGEAVERVRPYGVDASSGLEEFPGKKDESKVFGYIRNAKDALFRVHGSGIR
ncbi:MAG: phosphoribosylanthranilate isomerase [Armatimonadetes bacterium]|nr:phosphoribosylanthranilate isomerase [Armatimonadota bacterium]MBS1712546.1 phosphoribosylanthranilate isomerase [Armatimonadota bacterium]MBX3109145.1 phosphoribosylanthranilate isomerase [Fimbriimonadaceae bacterium]